MEVIGRVKKVLEVQTFSSGFRKRELIIQTEEQYPQVLSIEFLQDKVSLLDSYNEGDEVKVSINLRGREWVNPEGVTKYFNSIVGWRIENASTTSGSNAMPEAPVPPKETFSEDFSNLDEEGDDDLPF